MTPAEIASELVRTAARLRSVVYGCDFTEPRQAAASLALTIAADAVNAAAFRFDPAAAELASDECAANRAPIQYIDSGVRS